MHQRRRERDTAAESTMPTCCGFGWRSKGVRGDFCVSMSRDVEASTTPSIESERSPVSAFADTRSGGALTVVKKRAGRERGTAIHARWHRNRRTVAPRPSSSHDPNLE